MTTKYDSTDLHQAAAENGHTEVVKLLLTAGADVNWRNHEGVTSLYMAAQNGHDQVRYASVDNICLI